MKILSTEFFKQKLAKINTEDRKVFEEFCVAVKNLSTDEVQKMFSANVALDVLKIYSIGNLQVYYGLAKDTENNLSLNFIDIKNE